jgi:hypothetical protein
MRNNGRSPRRISSFAAASPVLSFLAMSSPNNPTPQFGTAEYVGTPGNDHCQFCHQFIAGAYYRANDAMACPGCAEKMRGELAKDSHAAFVRGLLFGIGGAIVGLIAYATFAIVTGIVIGYASLAVGWLVGTAMIKGSHGAGGRRYQIAAVLLTYAAVSMAAIPVWIHYAGEHKPAHAQRQRTNPESAQSGSEDEPPSADSGSSAAANPRPTLGTWLLKVALLGLASPFLELSGDGFGGLIGLVILVVGMRFAWRITAGRPLEIFGPFDGATPPAR